MEQFPLKRAIIFVHGSAPRKLIGSDHLRDALCSDEEVRLKLIPKTSTGKPHVRLMAALAPMLRDAPSTHKDGTSHWYVWPRGHILQKEGSGVMPTAEDIAGLGWPYAPEYRQKEHKTAVAVTPTLEEMTHDPGTLQVGSKCTGRHGQEPRRLDSAWGERQPDVDERVPDEESWGTIQEVPLYSLAGNSKGLPNPAGVESSSGKTEPKMLPVRYPVRRRGKKWPAGGNNPGGAGEGYDEIMQELTEGDTDQIENVNVVLETPEEHERLARTYGEGVIIFTTMKNQPDKLAYFCQICQVQMNSRSNLEMHTKGGKHNQNMVLYESEDLTSTDYYEEQEELLTNKEKRVIRSRGWKKRQDQEESGQDWEYMEGGQIRDLRELVQGKVREKPGRGRGRGNPGRGRNGRELGQDWDHGEQSHDEGEVEEGRGSGSLTQDDLTVREKLVHIRDMLLQSEELKPYVKKLGDSGSSRRRTSDRNHAKPYLKGRYSPPEPNISSHLYDDEPPNVPPRDGPPYVPRRRDDPPYVPRRRDDPPYVPRSRDGPPFIPLPRDELSYVPRPRDEPPIVPRPRDEPPFVPRPRDEPSYVPRHREEGPYVPRPRDGPPYVPHPDEERPALHRPFPRTASTSSIRSSSGVPYVDSEPMPPRSTQSDDAAKTFALFKTLEGYKLNDDYDADTAAVALKTLVNSIKFFINSSCVADASVQVKLKQILDETSGKLETLRSLLREESPQSNAAMTVQDSASKLSYSRELYPSQQGPPAPSTTFQAPPKPYYTPFL